jgi:hypothetical protein
MSTATEWNVDAETYHGTTDVVSHSSIEVFRQSPRLYEGRFVSKVIPQPEPTEALLLGQWLHLGVLQPWKLDEIRRGKLLAPERKRLALADAMRDALMAHPIARQFIESDGQVEHSIRWTDPDTGLQRKCRRDKVAKLADGRTVIPDLKSAISSAPEDFSKACVNFGYHRTVDWYLEGHHELTGELAAYIFVVVSKSPPHEVAIYELDEEALKLGARQNRALLNRLAGCYRTGQWEAAHEKQINKLSLPPYAYYENQWEA